MGISLYKYKSKKTVYSKFWNNKKKRKLNKLSTKASWCFKSHTKNNHLSILQKMFSQQWLLSKSTVQEITYFYISFFHWVGTTNNIIIFLPLHFFDLNKEKSFVIYRYGKLPQRLTWGDYLGLALTKNSK